MLTLPYATSPASTPTVNGTSAGSTAPPASVMTVAPIMMMTSPAAASGVRDWRMRNSPGAMSPIAPQTSATPMNRRNHPGRTTGPAIDSIGSTSFIPPANTNSSASTA